MLHHAQYHDRCEALQSSASRRMVPSTSPTSYRRPEATVKILISACLVCGTGAVLVRPTIDLSLLIVPVRLEACDDRGTCLENTALAKEGVIIASASIKTFSVSIPGLRTNLGKIVTPSNEVKVTAVPVSLTSGLAHPSFPTLSVSYTSVPLPGRIAS